MATAGSFRAAALRHPWLASVLGQAGLAYLGPNLMAVSERLAALFITAGFPDPSGAIDVLLSYVIGMSTTEAAWLTTVARSGQTEAAFVARLLPAARQAAAGYDNLSRGLHGPAGGGPGPGPRHQVRQRAGDRARRARDPAALRWQDGAQIGRPSTTTARSAKCLQELAGRCGWHPGDDDRDLGGLGAGLRGLRGGVDDHRVRAGQQGPGQALLAR